MLPLDLHTLSWNDFFVSGIFFVGDILVTALLIPIIIFVMDNRKWHEARSKVGELSARYMDKVEFHFSELRKSLTDFQSVFPEAFAGNEEAHSKTGLETQRQMLFAHLVERLPRLDTDIEQDTTAYLQEMQMLSPAFTSEIMIQQMRFYQASIRPRSLALAALNYWVLIDKDNPKDIGVNEANEKLQAEAEDALRMLCRSSKLTSGESDGRLFIPQYAASKKFDSTDRVLYPNYDPIYLSLHQISTTLRSEPPPRLPMAEPPD
jgi:hypothetical protein